MGYDLRALSVKIDYATKRRNYEVFARYFKIAKYSCFILL